MSCDHFPLGRIPGYLYTKRLWFEISRGKRMYFARFLSVQFDRRSHIVEIKMRYTEGQNGKFIQSCIKSKNLGVCMTLTLHPENMTPFEGKYLAAAADFADPQSDLVLITLVRG